MNEYKVTAVDIVYGEDEIDAIEVFCHSICHNRDGVVTFEVLNQLDEEKD